MKTTTYFIILILLAQCFSPALAQEDLLTKAKKNLFRNPDSAHFYLRKNLVKNPNPTNKAETYKLLGILNDIHGDYEASESYYDSSLTIFKDVQNQEGLGDILSNKAELFSHQGELEKAITSAIEAQKIYEEEQLTTKAVKVKLNLANYNASFGATDKAKAYYQAVLQQDSVTENNLTRAYIGLGVLYNTSDEYSLALEAYKQALRFSLNQNNLRGLSIVYNNIGNVFNKLAAYDSAINNHLKSLQIKTRLNDQRGIFSSARNLAECYRLKGDVSRAVYYADKAQSVLSSLNEPQLWADYYYTKIGIAIDQGSDDAHDYFDKYIQLRDSLYSTELVESLASIEEKYEDETNLRKISELEVANVRSKGQRQLATVIAIGLLLTASLIFLQYQKSKKLNKVLDQKNHEIQSALEDKELLLKEIHHRVKNNLQTISSLLNLQSKYVDNEAKEAVQEGKNRVKSMALIHQKLYQSDNLKGIAFSDYLKNLSDILMQSYKTNKANIELELDVEPLNLDVDTAVPIGLILNELISNALKYAFPEGRNGKLEVSFKQLDDQLQLKVQDNGVGLEENALKKSSFGMMLIRVLAEKLDATLDVVTDKGTSIQLMIKNYKFA